MPNTLVALCLNTGGLERVQSSHALEVFVDVFTSRTYQRYASLVGLAPGKDVVACPRLYVACGLWGSGRMADESHACSCSAC